MTSLQADETLHNTELEQTHFVSLLIDVGFQSKTQKVNFQKEKGPNEKLPEGDIEE